MIIYYSSIYFLLFNSLSDPWSTLSEQTSLQYYAMIILVDICLYILTSLAYSVAAVKVLKFLQHASNSSV